MNNIIEKLSDLINFKLEFLRQPDIILSKFITGIKQE